MKYCCCGENSTDVICDCECSFLDEGKRTKYVEKSPQCNIGDDECLSCGS